MLQLTSLLTAALLATGTGARFNLVPFDTTVLIHPRGQPNYCLAYVTTKNSYPYEFKLRMERCNGQGEAYWQWRQDEATNTWVLHHLLNINRCLAANVTHTPPQNGDLASISECTEQVNEWQNFRQYTSGESLLVGPVENLKCLDRKDGNYVDGDVQLWDCVDFNTNQDWDLECVPERQF